MTSVKVANVTDRGFPISSLPSENTRLIKRHDMLHRTTHFSIFIQ